MYSPRKSALVLRQVRFVHTQEAPSVPSASSHTSISSASFLPAQRWPPMAARFPPISLAPRHPPLSMPSSVQPKSSIASKGGINKEGSVSRFYKSTSTMLKRITTKLRNKQVRDSINELIRRKKKNVQPKK